MKCSGSDTFNNTQSPSSVSKTNCWTDQFSGSVSYAHNSTHDAFVRIKLKQCHPSMRRAVVSTNSVYEADASHVPGASPW